ncbi:hypothetical protein HPP92_006492 [Vanilla planifolia]|uniref:Uncharacterized protein n=1 Tax=Vanilla planifolia TaxID=51239 RepID=A0A835RII3_VANPL|nr:hypothetical protein HPP92_006492 [Vanilla planifolia]
MPSEPLPWDRKEAFFKDRKHDRGLISDALGGGGGIGGGSCSTSRWRESYHGPRDLPRSSPRRPFPSHYRHGGGYHQIYPEDSSVHGCTSSRSGDRSWLDAEICRPSSGRYAGSGRSSSSGGRKIGDLSGVHHTLTPLVIVLDRIPFHL